MSEESYFTVDEEGLPINTKSFNIDNVLMKPTDKLLPLLKAIEAQLIEEGCEPGYAKRRVCEIIDEAIDELYKEKK